jgi:hypothetical protein
MKKIIEYKVVSAESNSLFLCEHFSRKINELIEKGWQPLGGVSVTRRGKTPNQMYTLSQSIVLYQD